MLPERLRSWGVTASVATLMLISVAPTSPAFADHEGPAAEQAAREILAALRANPLLLAPLAFAFVDRFTVGFYTTTFSLFLSRVHELPARHIGILIFTFMLPFALLSFPFGVLADRYSKTALLCGGSALYGVLTATLGFWPAEIIPFGMAVIGMSAAVMFVPSLLMTTELVPDAARSTALGAFNAAGSLGFIIGPLTGGLVSEWVASGSGWPAGYRAAFLVAGGSEVLLAVLAWPALARRPDRQRRVLGQTHPGQDQVRAGMGRGADVPRHPRS